MDNINISLILAAPEILLVGMILLLLLLDAFTTHNRETTIFASVIVTLLGACCLQIILSRFYQPQPSMLAFNSMFILDSLAQTMKIATYLISIIIVLYTRQYVKDKHMATSEFYVIFLFAILGMLVMISANNLLILYIGLELLSLALYGLIAINHSRIRAIEAAMKFFILSALASGLLLFGISFIYGATGGNLQLDQIFYVIHENHAVNHAILVFGLVFIVAGLVFKLGLAPFHMWVPDVYEGSPLPIATIIGTVTKIAAVVFVVRFLISALAGLSHEWSAMLLLLAIISLFIGNIVAIGQTNIKRMLAYSTVAHMGFVALGFMVASAEGLFSVLFYLLIYVITALAGFGVLMMLSHSDSECENIADLKGLSKTHPIYAGIMLLVMFSLAGIPPLAGFYAKFKILEALIDVGYMKTAVYAVIMSLIGAFYYIRVVKVMYFEYDTQPRDTSVAQLSGVISGASSASKVTQSVLVINGLLLLVLGIMPNQILNLCVSIINS